MAMNTTSIDIGKGISSPIGIAIPMDINIQSSWLLLEFLAILDIYYNKDEITDKDDIRFQVKGGKVCRRVYYWRSGISIRKPLIAFYSQCTAIYINIAYLEVQSPLALSGFCSHK
jgi:hypothetical protein